MKTEFMKTLRELKNETGLGLMVCKEALKASDGEINKALQYLREKGVIDNVMDDKPDIHREGRISTYSHGKFASMVELNCTKPKTSEDKEFKELAYNLCLQVASCNPRYVRRHEVPFSEINLHAELFRKQNWKSTEAETQAEVDRLLEEEYYPKVCLLDQEYIKSTDTVQVTLDKLSKKLDDKITIGRFIKWKMY